MRKGLSTRRTQEDSGKFPAVASELPGREKCMQQWRGRRFAEYHRRDLEARNSCPSGIGFP